MPPQTHGRFATVTITVLVTAFIVGLATYWWTKPATAPTQNPSYPANGAILNVGEERFSFTGFDINKYPLENIKISCSQNASMGYISNLSINGPDDYPIGYETSGNGTCTWVNGDYKVTVNITSGESPTSETVDTSDWLTYTNPTYGITMKYPTFYAYTKKTTAFEAQDKPFTADNSYESYDDHIKINILLRKLDGYSDSSLDLIANDGGGGDFKFAYSNSKGWHPITLAEQLTYVSSHLPREYDTKSGITSYVSGKFILGSGGAGSPNTQFAYIESPDKTFVMRLQIDSHGQGMLSQATLQTIYQMLDTLEFTEPIASPTIKPTPRAGQTPMVTCAQEGEKFAGVPSMFPQWPTACCVGLTKWYAGMDTRKVENGRCVETGLVAGSPWGYCIRSGDGICGGLENACNSPQDCR